MELKKHIFLIGMMGTGKTTIGKKLARHIQLPLVDMDHQLESRWGFSISEFFERYGERDFRKAESDLLRELITRPASVIITGGGIVIKPENRDLMTKNGWVIQLTAHPDELIRRLANDQSRPLLKGDPSTKIKRLLKEREKLYQFAHLTIDTTERTPDTIVEEITRLLFNFSTDRSC